MSDSESAATSEGEESNASADESDASDEMSESMGEEDENLPVESEDYDDKENEVPVNDGRDAERIFSNQLARQIQEHNAEFERKAVALRATMKRLMYRVELQNRMVAGKRMRI
jgi:hypothetical protein